MENIQTSETDIPLQFKLVFDAVKTRKRIHHIIVSIPP